MAADLDIAALRKLLAEAQHLPWLCVANSTGDNWTIATFGNSSEDGNDYELTTDRVRCSEYRGDAKHDAALCAAAVNALPALLDAAEERSKLRQYLDDTQDELHRVRDHRDALVAAMPADDELAAAQVAQMEEQERLVCAQAGIEYEPADDRTEITVIRAERDALRAQRDGLLAAAEEVCDYATDLRKRNMELVGVTWAGESPLLVRCRSAVSACKETR